MDFDINLIAKEEKQEQVKTKVLKAGTVVAVLLLVLSTGGSGYFYVKATGLRSDVKSETQEIADSRQKIDSMADIEITARNLYQKYIVISDIFSAQPKYSYLLEHFDTKIPLGVVVNSFSFSGAGEIILNGNASNYMAVSEFVRNLSDDDNKVFTSARISSVTLQASNRTVDFDIAASYDEEALKAD